MTRKVERNTEDRVAKQTLGLGRRSYIVYDLDTYSLCMHAKIFSPE
jgi:hypothetical protein